MRYPLGVVLCVGVAWAAVGQAGGQAQSLSFADPAWDVSGPAVRVARGERGDELIVEDGEAARRDVKFEDGTVEFDVRLTRRRSFVFVGFRMVSDEEGEEVYLRPHKSALPDAIQYNSVRQGQGAWQLYHGPGRTAAAAFEFDTWTHVRLVVQGTQAAIFLDDHSTPALRVDHLARRPEEGFLMLRGYVPDGTPGTDPAARFANVRVRPGRVDYAFPPPVPRPVPDGQIIRRWAVSDALQSDGVVEGVLPATARSGARRFTVVDADADGLVELHQWRMVPGQARALAVAEVTVSSAEAQTVVFDLGFSDTATVFLNGRPVFHGQAGYSFDEPRRDGLIGFDQARLYLPLTPGQSVLSVVVGDVFGGWGLMGRFVGATGLEVHPSEPRNPREAQ